MTEQVYPTINDLPVIAEEGDIAIVEADGSVYHFLNGLGDPTYSWLLNNEVSNKFSLKDNIIDTFDSFHISFWNFAGDVSGDDYFNINLNRQDSSINVTNNQVLTMSDDVVAVKPISPLTENYPSSLRYNANSYLQFDSSFDDYDSVFKNFTIDGWYRNRKTGFLNVNNSEAICTIDGSLSVKNRGVSLHGRDWTFDSFADLNFKNNTWEHFAYTYDGYDINYFKDGKIETGTFDNNAEYSHGILSTSALDITRDAGFQAKVYFESGSTSDHVLFQIGSGSERTILHIESGILKLECHGLEAISPDYPVDDAFHVVSWDYKVDSKRIRLFIDGKLKATALGSPWVSNFWGNKEVEGIADFGTVEQASVKIQNVVQGNERHYYGGSYYRYYDTPMDMTEVSNGNLLISDKLNYGPAYCVLGAAGSAVGNRHIMDPNSNDLYYFEMSWNLPASPYGWFDYANLELRLMHAGWDGNNPALTVSGVYSWEKVRSHIYEYNVWGSYNTGSLRKIHRNEYDNTTYGYFAGGSNTTINVAGSKIYSIFLDFANQRVIKFLNGTHYSTEKFNLHHLAGRTPDGGGVILAFQDVTRIDNNTRRYWWSYNRVVVGEGTGPAGALAPRFTPYDTRRPEAKAKITFNSNEWFYDPAELHIQYVQAKASGVALPGRNEYPNLETNLLTLSSPHMYARSDNHNDWMKEASASVGSDSAYPNDLRYFPQCFNEFNGKILTVGADTVIQNDNNETGLSYAQQYVTQTGGTIRTVNATVLAGYSNNLRNYIDTVPVNGDAIYLEAGTYECSQPSAFSTEGIHGKKSILICGSDTRQVKINFNSTVSSFYGLIFATTTNENAQLAFLTLNRTSNRISTAQNANTVFMQAIGGKAYKVTFDFNNRSFTLLYDAAAKKTSSLVLEKCHFKNYSTYYIMTRGYAPTLTLIDNTFEDQFTNVGISTTTSHRLIGNNKSFMNLYKDSSERIFGSLLDGHMKNFMIRSGVQHQNSLTPPDSVGYYSGLQNDILIESFIGYRDLLRVSNDGVIYKKGVKIGTSDSTLKNQWVFNEFNYDGSNFTIRKNGTLSNTFVDLFDSHSLDSCEINWGFHDSYNISQDNYLVVPPQRGDLIHEILVDNNVRTYSSIPREVRIRDSDDLHFPFSAVTFTPISDSVVDVVGSLTATQAGPYASGSRAWFQQGSVNPGFDSISRGLIYNYNNAVIDSGLFVSYGDSLMSSDMIGAPYDITVDFSMTDDAGAAIRWNVNSVQTEKRVRIGYDSLDGGKFLLRQHRDSSLNKDRIAEVIFEAELINKVGDSLPLFRLDGDGLYLTPAVGPHTVTYHYLGVDVGDQASPYHLQRMLVKSADNSINDSDYIFITDSGLATSVVELYDSLGELP